MGGVWVALVMLALAVLLPKVTTRSVDLAEPGEPLPYVSLSTLDATAGIWAERSRPDHRALSWRRSMCRSRNAAGRSG